MTVEEILELLHSRGAAQYGGEVVSQLEHALQCAALAENSGATRDLVAACFLHDLGHLLDKHSEAHQRVAATFLRGTFPDTVLEPIRLHVDAKRSLCFAEPGYREALSPASKHSLELQGGPFDALAAEAFLVRPYVNDAIALRRWDDLAKVLGMATPGLAHFAPLLREIELPRLPAIVI